MGSRERFHELVDGMFDRAWFTNNGPLVQEFEQRIAEHHQVDHCVVMCNGTIALEIAIRALGLTGEVIVPSYTFIATAHALSWQGITPVFADIDPTTHNLDPAAVEAAITPRTTGIIGVHLWGRPADVTGLTEVAERHDLRLLFDAAHAFGVSIGETMIGNFGDAEVFSFHATKFFNSFEGGAIVTNDAELADKARLMRNFGFAGFDDVVHPGTNGKMVEVCAAMGIVNLEAIDEVIDRNRRNHESYARALAGVPGVELLPVGGDGQRNYQYVVVTVAPDAGASRDEIVAALQANGVLARRYFWPGCHNMAPYKALYPWAGSRLPVTEQVADQVVVLPTGTAVTDPDIDHIADVIRRVVTGARSAS
ncbi:aminotransferase class I/II-fold pyridoxal phosphate-dependent enzyme [Nocardioides kongjuensis]|nr:DegT/DnrJ/EryC1/StrS family aminotransferase [Nocardioides kongjuensis]